MDAQNLGPDGAYCTRLLTPPDISRLQTLFDRSTDYFEIATGAPPAKDEAARAFVAGPPSKSVDEKRTVGVFDRSDELIGVLDAIVDWPDPGVWAMGMLLLEPASRGSGLGTAVLKAYETWAGGLGASQFRTAIVSHHERGRRFLEGRGYWCASTVDDYNAGAREATVLFYSKTA